MNGLNNPSLIAFLTNIKDQVPSIDLLVTGSAYVIGATFGIIALTKAAKHAKAPEQVPFAQVVAPFVVCIFLMWLPTLIGTIALTTFGTLKPTILGYSSPTGGLPKSAYLGLISLVRLFALIAVIRGVIMLKGVGEGKGGDGVVGRALFHIFGGVLLYYIEGTAKIISTLFVPV